jgi:hypothetical protein
MVPLYESDHLPAEKEKTAFDRLQYESSLL